MAFIHHDSPPSSSLQECPQNKEAPSPAKEKNPVFSFFFCPFKTQSLIALFSSAHASPANPTAREKNVELVTHVHTQNKLSCSAWEEALDLSLAHSHKGTMAKLKMIGHVVC